MLKIKDKVIAYNTYVELSNTNDVDLERRDAMVGSKAFHVQMP